MHGAVCGGCDEAGLWVGLSLRNWLHRVSQQDLVALPAAFSLGRRHPRGRDSLWVMPEPGKDLELPATLPYKGYELGCQMLFVLRPRGAGDHRIGDICGPGGQRGKMWFPRP